MEKHSIHIIYEERYFFSILLCVFKAHIPPENELALVAQRKHKRDKQHEMYMPNVFGLALGV